MSVNQAKPGARPQRTVPPQAYPAEKARQGQIVLNTTARRLVFFGGLALAVVVAILLRFVG